MSDKLGRFRFTEASAMNLLVYCANTQYIQSYFHQLEICSTLHGLSA